MKRRKIKRNNYSNDRVWKGLVSVFRRLYFHKFHLHFFYAKHWLILRYIHNFSCHLLPLLLLNSNLRCFILYYTMIIPSGHSFSSVAFCPSLSLHSPISISCDLLDLIGLISCAWLRQKLDQTEIHVST